jgi:exodeoxyribonuclease VII small subunit
MKKNNKDSFEYYFNNLEEILDKLESNIESFSLEELLKMYQDGLTYIKECRNKLNEAELKIEKINSEQK